MKTLFDRFKEASTYGGVGIILLGGVMIQDGDIYIGGAVVLAGLIAVIRKELGSP